MPRGTEFPIKRCKTSSRSNKGADKARQLLYKMQEAQKKKTAASIIEPFDPRAGSSVSAGKCSYPSWCRTVAAFVALSAANRIRVAFASTTRVLMHALCVSRAPGWRQTWNMGLIRAPEVDAGAVNIEFGWRGNIYCGEYARGMSSHFMHAAKIWISLWWGWNYWFIYLLYYTRLLPLSRLTYDNLTQYVS